MEGVLLGAALPAGRPRPGLGADVPPCPPPTHVDRGCGRVVASLTVTVVLFWNTAENIETFSGGKADIYVAPKPHRLTKVERNALVSVAQRFVESAVARDHPERAYEIVGPALRGGLSKQQWATGDIPVVPYPVGSARWRSSTRTKTPLACS